VNPTRLRAGYKVNVIPQEAVAEIDGRFLPGHEDEFFAQLDRLIGPKLARDVIHRDIAVEVPAEGALYQAMTDALVAADPGARVVPYTMFGGTDAKAFSLRGIQCYGYAPLQLPADLDFSGMFHGIDERVPVDGLRFGTRVLDAFLDHC
jgi:acetylornithine deacetylase/succinyl-diaminopimelate desuccinylase-like protein